MTLDDLLEEAGEGEPTVSCSSTVKVLTGEVVDPDEDFDEEPDFEEGMLNAMNLLEDCCDLLEEVLDPKNRTVTLNQLNQIEKIALETRMFLYEWKDGKND